MEPQLPNPNIGPQPGPLSAREHSPELRVPNPQENLNRPPQGAEAYNESRERVSGAGAGDGFSPVMQPQSQAVPPPSVVGGSQPLADDTPLTAADEDLIEMEWVNKAKKIINETKSDPYLQEQEVSKLQASYLQKRYGKDVKLADDK